jgi:hypothetical protein
MQTDCILAKHTVPEEFLTVNYELNRLALAIQ